MNGEKIYKILEMHDICKTQNYINKARSDEFSVCIYGCGKIGTTFGKELIDELNIKVDFYCDSSSQKVGKEIFSNVYCKDKEYLLAQKDKTICFLLIGYADIESACESLVESGVEYIVTYDDLLELPEIKSKYLPFLNKKEIAVYTCITNGYDNIRRHEYISDKCDYFVITDNRENNIENVNVIDLKKIVPPNVTDPIFQNRYCKMLPHKIFQEYRYSIYVDGNITLIGPIEETIKNLKKARIATGGGNYTDNYFAYALRCAKMGADYENVIMKQISNYYNQGLPDNVGSYMCGVLVREHNNPFVVNVMEEWWNEYNSGSIRDQISFPYVLWKNGFTKDDVLQISEEYKALHYINNPFWKYERAHKKNRFTVEEKNGE